MNHSKYPTKGYAPHFVYYYDEVRAAAPSAPAVVTSFLIYLYGDSTILAVCIFSQSATGEVFPVHIFASWPYLGVGCANFRKRAQRAVARLPIYVLVVCMRYAEHAKTVQTCGPRPASYRRATRKRRRNRKRRRERRRNPNLIAAATILDIPYM